MPADPRERRVVATARSNAADLEVPPALLAGLVELVRWTVRDELRAAQGDAAGDPVVPVDKRAQCSRRQASEWCRSGRIPEARKVGKRWHARASTIDSALEAMGESARRAPAPLSVAPANDGDTDRALLDELGLEVAPAARKARR